MRKHADFTLTAGEEVWNKFENAKAPELRVGTSIPPSFSPGRLMIPKYDSMTIHPVSSRDL
jgi:p21-activated kinase 1